MKSKNFIVFVWKRWKNVFRSCSACRILEVNNFNSLQTTQLNTHHDIIRVIRVTDDWNKKVLTGARILHDFDRVGISPNPQIQSFEM